LLKLPAYRKDITRLLLRHNIQAQTSGKSKKLCSITTCRTSLEVTPMHASACMLARLAKKTTGLSSPAVASSTQTDTSSPNPRRKTTSSSVRLSIWQIAEKEKKGFLHLTSIEDQSITEDCSVKSVCKSHHFWIELYTRDIITRPMFLQSSLCAQRLSVRQVPIVVYMTLKITNYRTILFTTK